METKFEWKEYSIPLELEDTPIARAFLKWAKEEREKCQKILEKRIWDAN